METKVCNSCHTPKPVSDFHRRGTGYKSACKECRRIERFKVLKIYYSHRSCSACGVVLSNTNEFFRRVSPLRNDPHQCRDCERTANTTRMADGRELLKRDHGRALSVSQYGLSWSDYQNLLTQQDYRCASCRDPLLPGRHSHIDHCHHSNKVRGVLCRRCNIALGLLDDNPVRVAALLQYIGERQYA